MVTYQGYAYGNDAGIWTCIDLKTGERKWKGGRYGKGQAVLLENSGLLLIAAEDGQVALVLAEPNGYTEVASFKALEGKTWKLTSLTISPAVNGQTEVLGEFYDPCEQDDLYKLNANNAFILDEGASKCDPAYPQTRTGTWTYDKNSKILKTIITGTNSYSNEYYVSEITNDYFKTNIAIQEDSVNYTLTGTFRKQ